MICLGGKNIAQAMSDRVSEWGEHPGHIVSIKAGRNELCAVASVETLRTLPRECLACPTINETGSEGHAILAETQRRSMSARQRSWPHFRRYRPKRAAGLKMLANHAKSRQEQMKPPDKRVWATSALNTLIPHREYLQL